MPEETLRYHEDLLAVIPMPQDASTFTRLMEAITDAFPGARVISPGGTYSHHDMPVSTMEVVVRKEGSR